MTASWVAVGVRARHLGERRLGRGGAHELAAAANAADAAVLLQQSSYERGVDPGMSIRELRRAVASSCIWNLRVLAGWLPPRHGDVVRVFAARFELENVADRAEALRGRSTPSPHDLGALATAWSGVAAASTADEVRRALAGSPWGDPHTTAWPELGVALEARWAAWLSSAVPGASAWAAGRAALVAAGEIAAGRPLGSRPEADIRRVLGRGWEEASDVVGLASRLGTSASWVLDGIGSDADLWVAESRWWARVDEDAARMARVARAGPSLPVAAAARLVADSWWTTAALDAVACGPPRGLEAFDAVA